MTQKEEEIKQKLLALIAKGTNSGNLSVNFSYPECRSQTSSFSNARRDGDHVIVNLLDPGIDEYKLGEWEAAINQANKILDLLSAEKAHASKSPNFFKAIQAIVNNPEKTIHYVTD